MKSDRFIGASHAAVICAFLFFIADATFCFAFASLMAIIAAILSVTHAIREQARGGE